MCQFEFVSPRTTAREIERLAREFDLTEAGVIEQLVELGLDELEQDDASGAAPSGPRP
jgi:hypothetical protein